MSAPDHACGSRLYLSLLSSSLLSPGSGPPLPTAPLSALASGQPASELIGSAVLYTLASSHFAVAGSVTAAT